MRQQTLAEEGFEKYRKLTRREQFLNEIDQIIPWAELSAVIEPFYPKDVLLTSFLYSFLRILQHGLIGCTPLVPIAHMRLRAVVEAYRPIYPY